MVHHVYTGIRDEETNVLLVSMDGGYFGHESSLRVCNHSPTGFDWGYGGSGPAQLALALLLEVAEEETAVELHQAFKWEVVAAFPRDRWRITTRQLCEWVRLNAGPTQCLAAPPSE
jgi:hypothetical protein